MVSGFSGAMMPSLMFPVGGHLTAEFPMTFFRQQSLMTMRQTLNVHAAKCRGISRNYAAFAQRALGPQMPFGGFGGYGAQMPFGGLGGYGAQMPFSGYGGGFKPTPGGF